MQEDWHGWSEDWYDDCSSSADLCALTKGDPEEQQLVKLEKEVCRPQRIDKDQVRLRNRYETISETDHGEKERTIPSVVSNSKQFQ